jgi:hypothetical protein
MICFYHNDMAAVGVCKSCNRGLCADCAADEGSGLACKGRCEERVKQTTAMVDTSLKNYQSNQRMVSRAWVNSLLFASVFIGFGLYTSIQELKFFMFAAGAVYVYMGFRNLSKK